MGFLCSSGVLLLALVVAGCGSSSSDTSSSGSTSVSTTSEEAKPASVDFASKTIGFLDVYAAAPSDVRFFNGFQDASEHIGWKVQFEDAAGEPEKALTEARTLLNNGVDAIVTSSIPAEWLRPIVGEAESKGVPIVQLLVQEPPGVFTGQIVEEQKSTSAALAKLIAEENPSAEMATVTLEEFPALVERAELVGKDVEASGLKVVASKEVSAAEVSKVKKETQDILTGNSGIGVFASTAEISTPEVLAGLRAAGNSEAKVYAWYATSGNVGLMETNPQLVGVVDSDIAKVSWIAAGELLSYFSGNEIKPLQTVETTPVIVTKADITPEMKKDEGPVPFSKISAPFYKEWEQTYGIK
jgi:ABC-type sugar transport system substrate-binding protein